MPTKKELLAFNKNNEEMCQHINAKSLKFLSLNGLYEGLEQGERNESYPQFSDHYFTGDYPIKPIENTSENKIKFTIGNMKLISKVIDGKFPD